LHDTILALAKTMTGASAEEEPALELLCSAAEQSWAKRLPEGLDADACGSAFPCACACTAAAGLVSARNGDALPAFTAGSLSVGACAGGEAAGALLQQAERLMAPWALPDDFAFLGVRS
jgi:hypothetical protein